MKVFSFQKRFCVMPLICLLLLSSLPISSAVAAVVRYSSCQKLNKQWPKGVAVSSLKAKLQIVKPTVNPAIYKTNSKLDFDKDGTVCEIQKKDKTTSVSSPILRPVSPPSVIAMPTPETVAPIVPEPVVTTLPAAVNTTTTVPVVCPSSLNVTATIQSGSDISYRTTGISVVMYYHTRSVRGYVRNSSDVPVQVLGFVLAGNIMKGNAVTATKSVDVFNNVSLAPGEIYGWSKTYEALGHRITHSDYTEVVRAESVEAISFISLDSRCPNSLN
jgi:hypothetical protein